MKLSDCGALILRQVKDSISVFPPDRGAAKLGRKLQRHKLRVHGQPAVRPHLLRGGFLRPSRPHGPGLPAHLCHRYDPRAADRDTPAGRLRPRHRDRSRRHCQVVHFLGSTGALPPQDNDGLLFLGAGSHSQQPHAHRDEGGKDAGGHNGLFLPMLGAVLHHQRGGPLHPLLRALAAVDDLAVARVHKLGVEPLPVRLPEPRVSQGVPGDPLLRG